MLLLGGVGASLPLEGENSVIGQRHRPGVGLDGTCVAGLEPQAGTIRVGVAGAGDVRVGDQPIAGGIGGQEEVQVSLASVVASVL